MKALIRATLTALFVALLVGIGSGSLADSTASSIPASPAATAHTAAAPPPAPDPAPPAPVRYTATAYCQHGVTQSGAGTHSGVAAADPSVLPVGSVVHVETHESRYTGIYTVLDTGTKVLGKKLDLFMHDCQEAQRFGRQPARVQVLRRGWSPKATTTDAQHSRDIDTGTRE